MFGLVDMLIARLGERVLLLEMGGKYFLERLIHVSRPVVEADLRVRTDLFKLEGLGLVDPVRGEVLDTAQSKVTA